jgi:hypothetical protein
MVAIAIVYPVPAAIDAVVYSGEQAQAGKAAAAETSVRSVGTQSIRYCHRKSARLSSRVALTGKA